MKNVAIVSQSTYLVETLTELQAFSLLILPKELVVGVSCVDILSLFRGAPLVIECFLSLFSALLVNADELIKVVVVSLSHEANELEIVQKLYHAWVFARKTRLFNAAKLIEHVRGVLLRMLLAIVDINDHNFGVLVAQSLQGVGDLLSFGVC